ncbi:ADP-ribosylglycohydrolase family protein [Limisalsivibrio acetivorans]|uniref:ADP-ribosylglycohydrolase family protein n=1 Tax=Limisalsivibrio acetivorans TaxID=1304888 RepID=UPI0003B2F524|nr:ADP-ribosylglycohydrolase family protein [Limisalsivibrio acetivorans]
MNSNKKKSLEHYKGCLVGGAVGDALGAPLEFMSSTEIISKYNFDDSLSYVEFGSEYGEFTDDTQMTLFSGEAVLRSIHRAVSKGLWGAINQIAFESYQRWLFTQGYKNDIRLDGWLVYEKFLYRRRAPGNTCLAALSAGIQGGLDVSINFSKGCGGVMRVAPAGLVFSDQPYHAFENGAILAACTHSHPTGYLTAGYFSALIALVNKGESLGDSSLEALDILNKHNDSEETAIFVKKAMEMANTEEPTAESIKTIGEGWVAEEALAIALYCSLAYADDFRKGVGVSVLHDGDSDSTGSITGNILGFINGYDSIPEDWRKGLCGVDIVLSMAEDLYVEYEVDKNHPLGFSTDDWNDKYPAG